MRTNNYNCPALLSEAVTQMVDDSEIPLKAIARDLGMPYTSLYRKLDPADDAMKVEVDLLFPLTKLCLGDRPKEPPMSMIWLPSKFGFRLESGEAEPDKEDVRDEMLDDCKMLREFHESMRSGEHPAYVRQFLTRIHRELDESMTRYERNHAQNKEGK